MLDRDASVEPASVERVKAALCAKGVQVDEVIVTKNRVRLASRQRREGRVVVRVSQRLLGVGEHVVAPLAGFFADEQEAKAALTRIIRELPEPTATSKRRRTAAVEAMGVHYDLASLLGAAWDAVEATWEGQVAGSDPAAGGTQLDLFAAVSGGSKRRDVQITWAPRRRLNRRQRGIKLGSYTPNSSHGPLIRIHPVLDTPDVPRWYVGFVVFHELLHHEIGVAARDARGRRILHPPEFRARERQHPRYAEAMAFERDLLWDVVGRR